MIHKKLVNFKDKETLKNENSVISIINKQEVSEVIKFYKTYKGKIKGISMALSLLTKLPQKIFQESNINYFSIHIDKIENLSDAILKYKPPKSFVEIILPINLFSTEIIENLNSIKRIIIEFDSKKGLENIDDITSEVIAKRFFPFTRGIPFCQDNIDQMSELFTWNNQKKSDKTNECKSCIFANYCSYKEGSNKFDIKPITKKESNNKDIIKFLEENENTTNRL